MTRTGTLEALAGMYDTGTWNQEIVESGEFVGVRRKGREL
jgi:hypothetical protein